MPNAIIAGFELAQESGVPVFVDPGPGNPDVPEDWFLTAIQYTDVVLVNDQEAKHFNGIVIPDKAAQQLLEMGPEIVVFKHGHRGNTIYSMKGSVHHPRFKVTAIDQTGAGDSMTAAIIYGYLNDVSRQETCLLANAAGAAKAQKRGTGRNLPTLDEIRDLLKSNQIKTTLLQK